MVNPAIFLVFMGQLEAAKSADFSKELQTNAVIATVRITNVSQGSEGTGAIIGRKGSFVYILTAHHVVEGTEQLEVTTFSPRTCPKALKVYRSVRLVAKSADMRDLALLRLATDDPMPGSVTLCPAMLMPEGKRFKALSVGCSPGQAPACRVDEVAGKKLARRQGETRAAAVWEVDGKQTAGRSGGPLLDTRGRLLGVCSGTNKEKSYFCHLEEIRVFLRESGFDWLI